MKKIISLACMAIMATSVVAQNKTDGNPPPDKKFQVVSEQVPAAVLSKAKQHDFDLNRTYQGRNVPHYSEGMCAIINNDGKWGFVDTNGTFIIPFQYSTIDFPFLFNSGWCLIQNPNAAGGQNKMQYIDRSGKLMPEMRNGDVSASKFPFSDGVALVSQLGSWSASSVKRYLYDAKGKLVPNSTYDMAPESYKSSYTGFSEGLAALQGTEKDKYGYIDKTGKMVIPATFSEARPFSEGLAAVKIGSKYGGKWGFIDKTGKVVIPATYDSEPGAFHNGLAGLNKGYDDLYSGGYIDKTGKVVITPTDTLNLYKFSDFSGDYAMATGMNMSLYVIDKTGAIIADLSGRSLSYGAGDPSGRPWFMVKGPWETNRIAKVDSKTRTVTLSPEGMSFYTPFYEGRAAARYTDANGITYRGFVNEQYEFVLIEGMAQKATNTAPKVVATTKLELTPNPLEILVGETATIKAAVTPANTTFEVDWRIWDESGVFEIVSISDDKLTCTVKGLKKGDALLRVQCGDPLVLGKIIVKEKVTPPPPPPPAEPTGTPMDYPYNKQVGFYEPGQKVQFYNLEELAGLGYSNPQIVWNSLSQDITIDKDGSFSMPNNPGGVYWGTLKLSEKDSLNFELHVILPSCKYGAFHPDALANVVGLFYEGVKKENPSSIQDIFGHVGKIRFKMSDVTGREIDDEWLDEQDIEPEDLIVTEEKQIEAAEFYIDLYGPEIEDSYGFHLIGLRLCSEGDKTHAYAFYRLLFKDGSVKYTAVAYTAYENKWLLTLYPLKSSTTDVAAVAQEMMRIERDFPISVIEFPWYTEYFDFVRQTQNKKRIAREYPYTKETIPAFRTFISATDVSRNNYPNDQFTQDINKWLKTYQDPNTYRGRDWGIFEPGPGYWTFFGVTPLDKAGQ